MKMWLHLVFLVLAGSSFSRGQNEMAHYEDPKVSVTQNLTTLTRVWPLNGSEAVIGGPTPSPPSSGSPTTVTMEDKEWRPANNSEDVNGDVKPNATTSTSVTKGKKGGADVDVTTAAVTSAGTGTPGDVLKGKGSASWGSVILVLIILVIIILSVVLFILRRISRTYSFDLHRPSPMNHFNEPTGTFEPVHLDDLDQPDLKDVITDDSSPPPVANGTSPQSEENGLSGDTAPEEQPDANGVETTPTSNTSNTSPPSGEEQADKTADSLSSANLLFDVAGEQQNENNNNPSSRSSDPFVEINLDEPAWCDQLLTNVQAPSSVIPFSFFSSSSSS